MDSRDILKQECEHSYTSYAVTNVHVLVVVGYSAGQTLGLLEFGMRDKVLNLREQTAALL